MQAPQRRPLRLTLAALFALPLAVVVGCSSTAVDTGPNVSTEKLYAEAKDESLTGNYDKAAKLYERLEGRAAGTLLGQQAQLERAWNLYKANDKASALAAIDRYIKLNPSSAVLDYAYYLRGLINFNDNLGFLSTLATATARDT